MGSHGSQVPLNKRMNKRPAKERRPAVPDRVAPPCMPRVSSGGVRRGIAAKISAVLRRFGVGPDESSQLVRVAPPPGEDGTGAGSVADLGRLMTLCAARTNCPHFGLLVGQGSILSSLGLVGGLMPPSQTVGKALHNLVRHLHQYDPDTAPRLIVSGGTAALSFAVRDPGIESADQIADGVIATGLNIMRTLCGPDWSPTEVLLPRSRPPDPGPFERLFRVPVRFEAGTAALIFPAFWLRRRIAGEEVLRHLFEERLGPPETGSEGSFSDRLRRVLRSRLPKEDCSAARIAGLFSMNRRTLNRHLAAEGTAFNILVNEVRFEIARQLLVNTSMTFCQIAEALAFSEASAFTRAFRRWSGQTPTTWRAEHHLA
jgi:AraC-like DNA-binding protein